MAIRRPVVCSCRSPVVGVQLAGRYSPLPITVKPARQQSYSIGIATVVIAVVAVRPFSGLPLSASIVLSVIQSNGPVSLPPSLSLFPEETRYCLSVHVLSSEIGMALCQDS